MKTSANTQSFQTMYIDDEAKDSDEKIVLIEEMSESLPEATGVLNSLFKEKFYGMVAAGSTISLADFRAKLYDYDKEQKLGASKDISEILKKIVDICYDCKCEMVYYKGPTLYENIPEDLKNVSIAFDLKGLFSSGKQITKDIWENLLDKKANFDMKRDFNKKSLKEQKELAKEMEKNKKDLLEAIKETPREKGDILNEMLKSMKIDENLQHYLGTDYADKVLYNVIDKANVTIEVIKEEIGDSCSLSLESMMNKIQIQLDDLKEEENGVSADDKDREAKVKSILEKRRSLKKEMQELKLGANRLANKILKGIVKIGIDKNNKKRFVIVSNIRIQTDVLDSLEKDQGWKISKVTGFKDLESIEWENNDLKIEEKKKSLEIDGDEPPPIPKNAIKKEIDLGPTPSKKIELKL